MSCSLQNGKPSSDRGTVGGGFSTFYPGFRDSFQDILRAVVSHGTAYIPEKVSLGKANGFRTLPFRQDQLDELMSKWKNEEPGATFWRFERKHPAGVLLLVGDTLVQHRTLVISIQRDYLAHNNHTKEFLEVVKDLYGVLHPRYGEFHIEEMLRRIDSPIGKVTPGTDLERGLPDIFWANFLGPEYVEMFGAKKVFSAPCYSVEPLSDGGALLLLSPSPLNYLSTTQDLDTRRLEVKKHLGLGAFDNGDPRHQGIVPKFRYEEEWKSAEAKFLTRRKQQGVLSTFAREDWEDWVENNESIARSFASEMTNEGLTLDFSENSLGVLDNYIEGRRTIRKKWSTDFIRKLGAYLSQMIIKKTGAGWYFPETEDVPSLKIGGIIVTPLVRVAKVLDYEEKLSHWYTSVDKTILRLQVVFDGDSTIMDNSPRD